MKRWSNKTLVCFNCRFKKVLKHEAAALLIMEYHNENRGELISEKHVMRVLDNEELKPVKSIPYYEGFVFRAICAGCNQIFDRKTEAGIQYAMAQHELFNYDPLPPGKERTFNHEFFKVKERGSKIVGKSGNNGHKIWVDVKVSNIHKIPRSEYISHSKDADVKFQESMAYYRITPEQLDNESTSITNFDPNIFWLNSMIHSFNGVNAFIYRFLKHYECPYCGKKTDESFNDLYWHYYREHYIKGHNFDLIEKLERDISMYDYNAAIYEDETAAVTAEQLRTEVKMLKDATEHKIHFKDTVISMLQQLVMVEKSLLKTDKFNHNRASNALYQLNRHHGISLDELKSLFFPEQGRSQGWNNIASKVFHGMVWTENKAPSWLDNVVKVMGDELGI